MRSDLPGYLADSEADGVCVINWYHKQFKIAAKERYFVTMEDILYFHSYMADYFLGINNFRAFRFLNSFLCICRYLWRGKQKTIQIYRDPEAHV